MNIKKISKKKISLDGSEKFIYTTNSIGFDDMQSIRTELQYFMKNHIDNKKHIDNALLTVTEVISNLIKHAQGEPDQIKIMITVTKDYVETDIADNAEPFSSFDAKMKAIARDVSMGAESGFGLGLIAKINDTVDYAEKAQSKDDLNHFITKKFLTQKASDERKRKKIFLIDDEPIALQVHAHMLKDMYDVMTFDNADKALELFEQHKPDLVISDLVMPNTCGMELRKKLSHLENGDVTPFVFLSGNRYEETSMYISRLGIDDFLCKPISEEKLKNVVARLLKRSQQVRESIHGQFSRDITEVLKPSLPEEYGGWKFALKYQVADAGGGDFILYKLGNDSMVAILADVMGHGQQAKFFTYTYAGYMRSMFRNRPQITSGAKFMDCLSKAIGEDEMLENVVMTCEYFQLFPDGKIEIVSAGHPKPILIKKSTADIRIVPAAGPLPGLTIENLYSVVTEHLVPGDKILFMTDGFIDVFEQTGMAAEALVETLKSTYKEQAPELSFEEYLWKSFMARQESSSFDKDDATIIIAEYGG